MKIRLWITCIIAVFMFGFASFAGSWVGSAQSDWRYLNDDGTYAANTWFQDADGSWYYFGPDSLMMHDAWIGGTYYVDSSGRMMVNATTPDGYRVGPDGKWIQDAQGGAGETGAASAAAGSSADAAGTAGAATGTAAGTASFDEIVDIFRNAFASSSNDVIQTGNIYGENNNTVVATVNVTADEVGYEALFVAIAEAVFEETFPEVLSAASEAYGQRVYLRIIYTSGGKVYDTVTY